MIKANFALDCTTAQDNVINDMWTRHGEPGGIIIMQPRWGANGHVTIRAAVLDDNEAMAIAEAMKRCQNGGR